MLRSYQLRTVGQSIKRDHMTFKLVKLHVVVTVQNTLSKSAREVLMLSAGMFSESGEKADR